jgi:hypothetical protein
MMPWEHRGNGIMLAISSDFEIGYAVSALKEPGSALDRGVPVS